ncbi:hypothetical protein J5X07_10700 [Actinomyces bowdenii]|uniref:DUF6571 family protein n=1 Tax=Actinomyces bowdenii TaxID=131109 RepID=UPI001ABC1148|nr:DUF6571 family protein [Actinomyces bowdenii]MBO3725486.1 hypothetical protein [Actinomyces bowdenii]
MSVSSGGRGVVWVVLSVALVVGGVVGVGWRPGGGCVVAGGGAPDGVSSVTERGWGDAARLADRVRWGGSGEQWDEVLGALRAGGDDAQYATGVVDALGAAGVVDCVVGVSGRFASNDLPHSYVPSPRPAAGNDVVEVMGRILSSASVMWADDDSEEFAGGLADAVLRGGGRAVAVTEILSASREVDSDGDGLLESVGLDYSDVMLVALAQRLENVEPPLVSGHGLGVRSSAMPVRLHPLSSVVHAMTGNPEAGREWLIPTPAAPATPDAISDGGSVVYANRIQQLIEKGALTDEQWTTGWARLGDRIDRHDGAPLSLVPPDEKTGDFDKSATATAVSGILNGLGSGNEAPPLSEEGRQLVSHIVARHPEAVDRSVKPGNPIGAIEGLVDAATGEKSYNPLLADRALTYLVGQISQSPEASSHLGEVMTNHHDKRLQEAVAVYNATGDPELIQEAIEKQSATNGFFAGAISHLLMVHGERSGKLGAPQITVTFFAAGLIPVAGPVASLAVSEGKPFAVDGLDGARDKGVDIESEAKSGNSRQVALALLNSGLYNVEDLQGAASRTGGGLGRFNENVDKIVDSSGKPLTSEMSPEQLNSADVQDGLRRIAGQLTSPLRPELDFRNSISDAFDEGYNAAEPESMTPPSHRWGS